MEYRIIYATDMNELEFVVNDFIKEKWTPQGGVLFTYRNTGSFWAQAMIKNINK